MYLTFGESVTGLETSDFEVTNGKVIAVTGKGRFHSATVNASAPGNVTVKLKAESVTGIPREDEAAKDHLQAKLRMEQLDGRTECGKGDYYFLGQGGTGGYHAWHSTDMKTWTHGGPVTRENWVTSADIKDGVFHIIFDQPNDEDPHLYVDSNLMDGKVGKPHGMVFNDPTHGSDRTYEQRGCHKRIRSP